MKKTIQKRNAKKQVQTTSSNNPYQQYIKRQEEELSQSSSKNTGAAAASQSTRPGNSTRREVPRMVKNRAGVSFKDITVKAIMGEEDMHLPTYLDKIRPTE